MINRTQPWRECFIAAGVVALGGCSISMPGPALVDATPTASIASKAAPNPIDARDWPVAEPALRAAIRAEAPAEPEAWSNPATGRGGRFLAVAGPFARSGATCRAFLARIEGAGTATALQGVGCLGEGGKVAFSDVSPWNGL